MMKKAVNLTFTYSEKEYYDAVRQFYFRNYQIGVSIIFLPLLFILGVFIIYLSEGEDSLALVLIIISLVATAMLWFGYIYMPKKLYIQNPLYREEYDLEYTDEQIYFHSQSVESKMGWNCYKYYWETEQFYFLVYRDGNFTALPKRAFTNKAQEETFRELLKTHIKPKGTVQEIEHRKYVPKSLPPPDWR